MKSNVFIHLLTTLLEHTYTFVGCTVASCRYQKGKGGAAKIHPLNVHEMLCIYGNEMIAQ